MQTNEQNRHYRPASMQDSDRHVTKSVLIEIKTHKAIHNFLSKSKAWIPIVYMLMKRAVDEGVPEIRKWRVAEYF